MAGPTIPGAEELIAQDPGAYWDTATNKVKGSAYGGRARASSRSRCIDPITYDSGKRNGRTADLVTANWIGFFLDHIEGNDLVGRIIPIAGIRDATAGPAPAGLTPKTIRLVQ